jgi:hypothetical protein
MCPGSSNRRKPAARNYGKAQLALNTEPLAGAVFLGLAILVAFVATLRSQARWRPNRAVLLVAHSVVHSIPALCPKLHRGGA